MWFFKKYRKGSNNLNIEPIDTETELIKRYSKFKSELYYIIFRSEYLNYLEQFESLKVENKEVFLKEVNENIYLNFDSIFTIDEILKYLENIPLIDDTSEEYKASINKFYVEFIYLYNDFINEFIKKKLDYFTKEVDFYSVYNPFQKDQFINFLVTIVAEKMVFRQTYNSSFYIEINQDELLLIYFRQVVVFIMENPNKYDNKLISHEIIRLRILLLRYNKLNFLEKYLTQLEQVALSFNKNVLTKKEESDKLSISQQNHLRSLLNKWFINLDESKLYKLEKFDLTLLETLKGLKKVDKPILNIPTNHFSYLLIFLCEKNYLIESEIKLIFDSNIILQKDGSQTISDNYKAYKSEFGKKMKAGLVDTRESGDNLKLLNEFMKLF
jgi:hypothetical protein